MSDEQMTWRDVLTHLQASRRGSSRDDKAVSLEWNVGKTPQRIVVLSADVLGQPSATVVAMIGRESSFSHRILLELCASLLTGGIILRDDVYLFRLSMPLATLSSRRLDVTIEYVGTEVERMRARAQVRASVLDSAAFSFAV